MATLADPFCYPSASDPLKGYRFHDCGNGTVLDTELRLLWSKNANCARRGVPFPDDGDIDWLVSQGVKLVAVVLATRS